jgi:hypothetical protein
LVGGFCNRQASQLQDGCQQLEPGAFTPGKSRKQLQANVLAKPDCAKSRRGPFAKGYE